MTNENELTLPVLAALEASQNGELSTTELRKLVKEAIPLDADDLKPLKNRNDRSIDQIIRNLKSHKATEGNPFAIGLLEDIPRGFKITGKGRRYLKAK